MAVLVFIGAVIGALCLVASFFVSGAPQQAALAAMACAFAIIPYVLFRVSQLADAGRYREEMLSLMKQDRAKPE